MTEPTAVRAATLEDRDQVWPLVRDFATSYVSDRAAFDSSYPSILAADDALLLVAHRPAGTLVGYLLAHVHLTLFANGPVGWVEELMVVEAARRTGVGRRLLQEAEEWGRSSGAGYLALATRRAGSFYRALGYDESAAFFKKSLSAAGEDAPRTSPELDPT